MADYKPHKYKFTNLTNGLIFVPVIKRTLSAKKVWPHVWEGVLDEPTKRMKDQKLIDIEDLGESSAKLPVNPLERSKKQEELERVLTKEVRTKLDSIKKVEESKAVVESVKLDAKLDETPKWASEPKSVILSEYPLSNDEVVPVEEVEEVKEDRLDSLIPKKKTKKKND